MSRRRRLRNRLLGGLLWAVGLTVLAALAGLAAYILYRGAQNLSLAYFTERPSTLFGTDSILPALANTLLIVLLCVVICVPLGTMASLYFNIYLAHTRIRAALQFLLDMVLGIPSIVVGYVGLVLFCRLLGLGTSLLAGAFTMCLTMLPLFMYTMRSSVRAVPGARILQARAMGASNWHVLTRVVLPQCWPGILYAASLVASRVIAESAALLLTAGTGELVAGSLGQAYSQSGGTLAVMLYVNAAERGDLQTSFAIAAVLLLLVMLHQFFHRRTLNPFIR